MKTNIRLRSLFTILLSSAALGVVAIGCGGSDDDGGNNGNGPGGGGSYTLDDVCEKVAAQQCAAAKPCCESSGIGYDEAACIASARTECDFEVSLVKAGKRTFHPEAVGACVSAVAGMVQKCEATLEELFGVASSSLACQYVFAGTVEEGGACEDDSECKPPSGENQFAACDEGKCVIGHINRGEGESCSEFDSCAEGLYCWADPDAGSTQPIPTICQKPKQAGEACTPSAFNSFECAKGLYCANDTSTCVDAKALGEACGSPVECATGNCQESKCVEPEKYPTVDEEMCKGVED